MDCTQVLKPGHNSCGNTKNLAFLILLILTALFLSARFSGAGASEPALSPPGYAYLSSPSSLHVSDSGISLIDGGTLLSFGFDGTLSGESALPSGTLRALRAGGSLVRMTASDLYVGNNDLSVTATALAVSGNKLYAASGDKLAIITLDNLSVGYSAAGGNIAALAAYGDIVFYVTDDGGEIILNKYADGATTQIKRLKAPVDALACLSANEVCYASDNSLTVYDVLNDNVKYSEKLTSFVVETCGYNGSVYYITSGGEVCRLYGGKTATVLSSASDRDGFYNSPGALTSRKDMLCVADRGNDRVSVLAGGVYSHIKIYDPADVAIDYNGNIYVAASQSVKVYNRAREALLSLRIKNNTRDITSIAIDYSEPVKNTVYALTDDGTLADLTSENAPTYSGGYKQIAISVLGDMYALNSSSEIIKLNKDTLTADMSFSPVSCPGAVDFTVDANGNIFAAYAQAVVKYAADSGAQEAAFNVSGAVGGIAVAMFDAGDIKYGDVLVTDSVRNCIYVCESVTAEMNDTEGDAAYYSQMTDNSQRTVTDSSIIHTAAVQNADIYARPAEMPAKYSVSVGTKIIVIDKTTYDGDGYWFVLTDVTGGGGVYGFINKNILTAALPYTDADGAECTVLADKTELKKYPSLYAPTSVVASASGKYDILPFVSGYKDIYGNEWLRISYGENYEAFVLRGVVSVDGKIIRPTDGNMPKANARIKAVGNETTVNTYSDSNGAELSGMTIDVGTEVEVIGTFNLSYDYTQIRYSFVDNAGLVVIRTCYVPTGNVFYEETTIYQIIAVIAIVVLIASAIALFIIKKRKENILSGKEVKY